MRLLLLMLQAGGPLPLDFDLARLPAPSCGAGGGDVVVCGRRRPPPRLPPLSDADYAQRPVRAEVGLGGGLTGSAGLSGKTMPDGRPSNRIMIGIKTPF